MIAVLATLSLSVGSSSRDGESGAMRLMANLSMPVGGKPKKTYFNSSSSCINVISWCLKVGGSLILVESILRAVAPGCGSILAMARQGCGHYSGDGTARLCSLFLALF
jgi:hypothetical protein